MVLKVKFGYRKLTREEAASGHFGPVGLRIAKDPSATPILHRMRLMVLEGKSYDEIANELNEDSIEPGPYAQNGRWRGPVVRDLLSDPILSGQRRFRKEVSKLIYSSGKHRPIPNPKAPETQSFDCLAHFTPEEHQDLLKVIEARREEAKKRIGKNGKVLPNRRVPRSQTLFPGQLIRCSICQGLFYRYGKLLKCQNAHGVGPRDCWNRVEVRIDQVQQKVLPLILNYLDQFPEFRSIVIECAWTEYQRSSGRQNRSLSNLDTQIATLEQQAKRITQAIAQGGQIDFLVSELQRLQGELAKHRESRTKLVQASDAPAGYTTKEEITRNLNEALIWLAKTSREFGSTLRRLISNFELIPVQALDRPLVRPRARLTLSISHWMQDSDVGFEKEVMIDLFDPPEHIKHLLNVVESYQRFPEDSETKLAKRIGMHYMAIRRTIAYHRLMLAQNTLEPYRVLTDAPREASRWRKRSRNSQ